MNTDKHGSDKKTDIESGDRPFDFAWLASCVGVTAAATFLRFFMLALKPFHHDEGVNGFFLTTLFRDGVYKYDPANYHGPTLYYITLAFTKAFGLETIPVRASVAIFGVLIVVLTFFLRRYIGKNGALTAALFLALSPGMVYISRYFIHEIFFVFLSLAIVLSVVFFIEKRKAGIFATAWMVLLLFVCFLPSALSLASVLGGESTAAVWAFRVAFIIIESVLVYFVIRMIRDWDSGRPVYLLLASASVALMFATKETAFITLGTMLIACLSVWIWRGIAANDGLQKIKIPIIVGVHAVVILAAIVFRANLIDGGKWLYENFLGEGKPQETFVFYSIILLGFTTLLTWIVFLVYFRNENDSDLVETTELTWSSFKVAFPTRIDLQLSAAAVATVFVYVVVLFFSSFFTYAEGVQKAVEAYAIWTKTGNKDHTQNGLLGYVKWGLKVEAPLLILSAFGALIALLKAKHRFAMFTAFWAFGLFAAYTIIPYKTPWLALSFYLPMCIIAGYGINELFASRKIALKFGGVLLAVIASSILAYQAYELNFVRYDDEDMAYVYAHSKREMLDLVSKIEYYAEKSGQGKNASIEIVSPDYWPLTWYMNDYKHATFHGSFVDANTAEMIVAKKTDQDVEVIRRYSAHYKFVGVYPLRPGVDLMLLVRKNLADNDAKELYKILDYESQK